MNVCRVNQSVIHNLQHTHFQGKLEKKRWVTLPTFNVYSVATWFLFLRNSFQHSKFCEGKVQNIFIRNYFYRDHSPVSLFLRHWKKCNCEKSDTFNLRLCFLNSLYENRYKFMTESLAEKLTLWLGRLQRKSDYIVAQEVHSSSVAIIFVQTFNLDNLRTTIPGVTTFVEPRFSALKISRLWNTESSLCYKKRSR